MKFFRRVHKLVFAFKRHARLTILFNILFAIFNLLSLALFAPTLSVIFRADIQNTKLEIPKETEGVIDFFKNIPNQYNYFITKQIQQNPLHALMLICVAIAVAFFLKNFFRYLAVYFQSYLRMAAIRDIRRDLYEKAMRLPMAYHTSKQKGDLMARMNTDTNEIEVATVFYLELWFREPFAIIMTVATLVYISPQLTLFAFILLPVTAFVISKIRKSLKRTVTQHRESTSKLFSILDETLGGMRAVKSFVAEKQVEEKFRVINFEQQQLSTKSLRKSDLASPLSEFLSTMVMVGLVWFGGSLILGGNKNNMLTGQEFITYLILFSQLLRPVQNIANILTHNKKAEISFIRIDQILNEPEIVMNKENALQVPSISDKISIENITFKYDQKIILNNLSFDVPCGKTIALVGESGSGKSTIADLLPRFYDVNHGGIKWDGIDIREFDAISLRRSIGVVSQESILFNDSVLYNISFGSENASREEIIEAAKTANAHDFIIQLENGYDTIVGERGNSLSGGQRQRISIARAILKNAPVLILDEATSALDTENEKIVQQSLEKLMLGKTTLVIAHRLSTIRNADQIIVLHKGEIVEQGKHQELIDKKGYYHRLSTMQGIES